MEIPTNPRNPMERIDTPLHRRPLGWAALGLLLLSMPLLTFAGTNKIADNGITWEFDKEYPSGNFCNGDFWVIGPVKIISITNTLNPAGFEVKRGQNGSMINPVPTPELGKRQGYDPGFATYDEGLNASLPNGKPVSPDNPVLLNINQTLISSVSFLYRSADDREPDCPKFTGRRNHPRPVTKAASILTCLASPPPPDSFRPPYCGTDKTAKFKKSDLRLNQLLALDPVPDAPDVSALEKAMSRTWVDHGYQWGGAMIHPAQHMPNYGRDMAAIVGNIALLLNLDFNKLAGKPSKERLAMNMAQFGIDLTGIADNGGGWPADGGHSMGRKWPILFAGAMLDDEHMKSVGKWKTRFQEDEQTFYVDEECIATTHSPKWNPDKRGPRMPYEKEHLGMPEWGIRHSANPEMDNLDWSAYYRAINGAVNPSFALASLMMNQKSAWEHDSFFDYCDRLMTIGMPQYGSVNQPSPFARAMWDKYRGSFGKSPWLQKGQVLPTLNERFKDSPAKAPPDNE